MSEPVLGLYLAALHVTAIIVLPAIACIAAVGIIVGLAQTLVGIQDQNLSFGPKIAAVVLLAFVFGVPVMELLSSLLRSAAAALPSLAH